jgi:hypothetical protein
MDEVEKNALRALVELAAKAAWQWATKRPWLLAFLPGGVAYFATPVEGLLKHPRCGRALFALLVWGVSLMAVRVVQMHWRYERLRNALGVFWDRKNNMYCLNCRKPLKHSSKEEPWLYFCSDKPNCDSKHVLKDPKGNKMTREQAIDWLKKNPK